MHEINSININTIIIVAALNSSGVVLMNGQCASARASVIAGVSEIVCVCVWLQRIEHGVYSMLSIISDIAHRSLNNIVNSVNGVSGGFISCSTSIVCVKSSFLC